ncbi:helix-turn-helix domain-containing protein [Alicyclobacillus dauci]|uniref:Helix-turn-helix domain-containing protein n=1 Tax=Alicyclobacillus dauci TaxID=1475485 RepID=A0ABY6Z9N1_9BACL|nr:helix-turn-helix domain-containing protein [Alicyclobacillus dauci]WAH39482.1 helix-turn-helix domain-containing protein [Alicyclobacillus dauci]WAH39542.1 helix-turn-helix domain-containing protein [Alicyclobacillus dauci]
MAKVQDTGRVKKGWTNNYFTVPNGIYEMDITGYAKAVYIYLCRRADSDGQSFPGYGTIATEVGFSKSTVRRAVDDLITAGLLIKETRGRKENGEFYPNLYTIIHPMDAVSEEVCSDRPYPPEGMLSQDIPMVSGDTPMLSQNIPMFSENTEVRSIKDNPITTPIKDTTHTHHVKAEIESALTQITVTTEDRVCDKFILDELKDSLAAMGIQVADKTLKEWLELAEITEIVYACRLATTQEGIKNPSAYITGVLKNGVVMVKQNPQKTTNDKRYSNFYKLFPDN